MNKFRTVMFRVNEYKHIYILTSTIDKTFYQFKKLESLSKSIETLFKDNAFVSVEYIGKDADGQFALINLPTLYKGIDTVTCEIETSLDWSKISDEIEEVIIIPEVITYSIKTPNRMLSKTVTITDKKEVVLHRSR